MAARSPLSLADESRLLAYLPRAPVRDQVLLLLGLRTGFRAAELASLTVGQVRLRDGGVAGHVTVERARLKGGRGLKRRAVRSRTVPLVGSVRALLGRFLVQRGPCHPAAALFPSRKKGLPLTPGQINRIVQRHLLGAGVEAPYLGAHSLRKSFAGRVYAATGNDLLATQAALGHRSVLSTIAYLGTMEARARQAVLAIDRPLPSFDLMGQPDPCREGVRA